VLVEGTGARLVAEGASLVYRKWVRAPRGLEPASLVVVESPRGEILGCALYDTVGPVALRMIWHGSCPFSTPSEAVSELIRRAYEYRKLLGFEASNGSGFRLVHSDGDMLPGLIIDVYDDTAVVQSSSIVWDRLMEDVVNSLVEHAGVKHVYEKSTQRTRKDIGLEPRERVLYGNPGRPVINEGSAKFIVDVRRGQKTGFFLDQRENRIMLERLVSEGDVVLDLFSYTGGFGIHALLAGAKRVVFVDEDADALRLLRENLRLNGLPEERVEIIEANVWSVLKRYNARGEKFDVVVVDPPAFIQSLEHKDKGIQAYERLYSSAARLAERILFLSSCSAFLSRGEFRTIVGKALARANRVYRFIGSVRGMPPDHPSRLHAEHLEYLKAIYVHIID
jgi:23S rRNA (cytosine1962-C5)-methyltransferase